MRVARNVLGLGCGLGVGYATLQISDSRSSFYTGVAIPALRLLDPETAHDVTIFLMEKGLCPRDASATPPSLTQTLWGREFANPIGLSAGFDKEGRAIDGAFKIGFGFVEVGSVTPSPQPGNPKPRVFRLVEDDAIINRYGFNSSGMHSVAARLAKRAAHLAQPETSVDPQSVAPFTQFVDRVSTQLATRPRGVLGVNLGKNKTQPDAEADYSAGVRHLGQFADYLVVNVSSPNTPNLRDLQGADSLRSLLTAVLTERDALPTSPKPPVLLKIAPDLTSAEMEDIASVALDTKIDGLIVSNTTVSRPATLRSSSDVVAQTGGLSGRPLMDLSTETLQSMYKLTKGQIPIIGVGGVSSADDAYRKIRSGASLVQLYSGLVYQGPGLVADIKQGLAERLAKDGFTNIQQAVGADVKDK